MGNYDQLYQSWMDDSFNYWAQTAKDIDWFKTWDKVQDTVDGLDRWFVGAECNTAYNCLDRHVKAGRGEQIALIYDSPVTGKKKQYSYCELLDEVATFGAVLKQMGVEKGDRVIIYMPMVPEASIAMLACARIGAIHSVVFGGFAAAEMATRIDDCKPKLIVAASCGIEPKGIVEYKPLLDNAIEIASHNVEKLIILQRDAHMAKLDDKIIFDKPIEFEWQKLVDDARNKGLKADVEAVKATDALYILYTSGTTGMPKGVVRDNGGHMVALHWSMKAVYDIDIGDVFWAASDVGWVVGHSYIVYGPLLKGATTVMFEGKPVGTPDAGAFWKIIQDYKVKSFFTAPTAFRAIKKEDPEGALIADYDLSHLGALFLAGERADPATIKWAEAHLKIPVIDHWWQTETGWAMASNLLGVEKMPIKYGSACKAVPGFEIVILDDEGETVENNQTGNVLVKRPLPPGCLSTLWQADNSFQEKYLNNFAGYYETSDAGFMDDAGYLFIMARTDDIINVAGHRLSTGAMEEVLSGHCDVAECAVIGVKDDLKGQIPIGMVILNIGAKSSEQEIDTACRLMMRQEIGPVAAYRKTIIVERLPKTRSGKILRATMRKIADSEDYKIPATIDDPEILHEISACFKKVGIL